MVSKRTLAIALLFAVAFNYIPVFIEFTVNGFDSSWFMRHLSNFFVIFILLKYRIELDKTFLFFFYTGYLFSFCGLIADYKFIDRYDGFWKSLSGSIFLLCVFIIIFEKYVDFDKYYNYIIANLKKYLWSKK